jgi:hypothetical protein
MKIKQLRAEPNRLETSANTLRTKVSDLIRIIDQEYPKIEDKEKDIK